jgi:hypothetical protein
VCVRVVFVLRLCMTPVFCLRVQCFLRCACECVRACACVCVRLGCDCACADFRLRCLGFALCLELLCVCVCVFVCVCVRLVRFASFVFRIRLRLRCRVCVRRVRMCLRSFCGSPRLRTWICGLRLLCHYDICCTSFGIPKSYIYLHVAPTFGLPKEYIYIYIYIFCSVFSCCSHLGSHPPSARRRILSWCSLGSHPPSACRRALPAWRRALPAWRSTTLTPLVLDGMVASMRASTHSRSSTRLGSSHTRPPHATGQTRSS